MTTRSIQMGRFRSWMRLTAMPVAVLALASCGRDGASATNDGNGDAANGSTTVAVAKVERGDLSKSVDITAEFMPWQNVEIHAKVSGYVKQINVDVGDHAKTGDVLAVLEIPELDQQLNEAKAALLTAQQDVKSIEAEFDETTLVANRISAAAKETKGLIAQQDVDNANDANRSNEAKLAGAKQKVVEAEADVARLEALVGYANVLAPFDGVVTRRYADTGALVQAGTVQAGTSPSADSLPLVSFAQLNVLRLEFPVPEADVPFVHADDTVQVNVVSFGKHFEGKIARFAQKVDMSTRTMLTEVDVPNPDYSFTPGMYATVALTLDQRRDVLVVPIQSVTTGDKPSVLVVQNGKIEKRYVTVGLETPEKAEIENGLEEGDLVVVGSKGALQAGQSATPKLVANNNP